MKPLEVAIEVSSARLNREGNKMPKIFFVSYGRPRIKDADPASLSTKEVDDFVGKLSAEVASRVQQDTDSVGFRDTCNIEAGTSQWAGTLAAQLAEYPVGIVLLEPAYLGNDRPWCKWECMFLASRNAELAGRRLENPPRLFLVLQWIEPFPDDVPHEFPGDQRVDQSVGGTNEVYREAIRYVLANGLRTTIQLADSPNDDARRAYPLFIKALGNYVLDQWHRWKKALETPEFQAPRPPPFDPLDRWAGRPTNAAEPARPRCAAAQRRKVYVVYIAAHPRDVESRMPQRAWRYREDGQYDWQAFAGAVANPDEPHIGDFVNEIPDVEVILWQFRYFCEHMEDALQDAEHRYPILFIVDPWTGAQLDNYYAALERYKNDFEDSNFSTPIVIWNDLDPDVAGFRTSFQGKLFTLFNCNRWQAVSNCEELKSTLRQTVLLLQQQIRSRRASTVPDSGSKLIRISAAT
jgi:hypothetical protein